MFGPVKRLTRRRGTYFAAAAATAAALSLATSERSAEAEGTAERTAWRGVHGTAACAGHTHLSAALPTEKLSCKMHSMPPRTPLVLVCCGSFNPPTIMHMRMVDLAGDELMRRGYDVWAAYLSPVADAYGKAGLAPAADRVAMCRLAAEAESASGQVYDSAALGPHAHAHATRHHTMNLTMVYDWEARQPGYTRTLAVLRRPHLPPVRAMLLCGGDVLASMAVPGVWRDPDVILREHGVVCVAREGTDLEKLLSQPGNVLHDYRERILVVYDRVGNSISSSKVREELAAGRPVRYLVPQSVLSYIYEKGLYGTGKNVDN
ncbi:hypothetical protein VOLCADRAFT_55034 [Volvox carteri f. nagariensis]|uniref:Cytidyltransferase-like domain-containing protein n=1 Tax=Volvox carteri f. nagariensis TaxID=3068 RepID=D8TGX8_VOLCA|nr:uncharacterized protein VOLCADRAFT_55034 [Volvox carteri f. nagariensis]EFJ52611.1 hypothetical protein VOLCADRAFT_55034 [Volvox carteri f. nagariensis]|eukprot:XP_002945616.1 hypothetical protein VOLCADRAFT_55034 [Volvox carteri f. nagariensis]